MQGETAEIQARVICLCNSNPEWGGGERWHLECALWFTGKGMKVVLCPAPGAPLHLKAEALLEQRPELAGLLLVRPLGFENMSFLSPFQVGGLARLMRQEGVTHVILGLPSDLKAAVMAARRIGKGRTKPKLFYRRGSAIPVRSTWFNRFLYRHLEGVIANSEETRRGITESGRLIGEDKVRVIHNGLDAEAFDAMLSSAEGWDLPRGSRSVVLGNAGRLNVQKGQKYLLHMSAYLKRNGFKHCMVIAGGGELEEELIHLAGNLGLRYHSKNHGNSRGALTPDVIFAGFLDDMGPFWRSIDAFVLSSVWEGFGYVLAEAMLAGKPLAAFNCNSMPELVKPGMNGELAKPPQAEEPDSEAGLRLGRAVRKIFDLGAEGMGQRGREFCLKNFRQSVVMGQLEELLFGAPPAPPEPENPEDEPRELWDPFTDDLV